jgi:hypothetical protein
MENPKSQALNPKQYQMTKIQSIKRFLPLEHADFSNFPKNSPLKIRGARGVMKITPFIPLTLRGIAICRAIEYLASKYLVFLATEIATPSTHGAECSARNDKE